MLLYCRNVKSTEDPTPANYIRLTAKYASDNVKDAAAPLVWISNDAKEIKEAELKGHDLFVASAGDELDFSDEKEVLMMKTRWSFLNQCFQSLAERNMRSSKELWRSFREEMK